MNAMIKQIWDDGGMVAGGRLACLVGGVQKRKISAFDQAFRRLDYESQAVGYVVERFRSDLGFEVEIITDPWVKSGAQVKLYQVLGSLVSKLTEVLKSLVEIISREIYEHLQFKLVSWNY